MTTSVIVWDIETVPDLRGFAAAKGLVGKPDDEVRAEMGDKFPKVVYIALERGLRGATLSRRSKPISWSLASIMNDDAATYDRSKARPD